MELFTRPHTSTTRRAIPRTSGSASLCLAEVAKLVQPHLEQVETRIAQQAAAFDPAIEVYVVYAVGSRGKRLRPLLSLLAGGATGVVNGIDDDGRLVVAGRPYSSAEVERLESVAHEPGRA